MVLSEQFTICRTTLSNVSLRLIKACKRPVNK